MLIKATVVALLSGLSADVKRNSYLESINNSNYTISYTDNLEGGFQTFLLEQNNSYNIFEIKDIYDFNNISETVKRNAINLLENLSTIFVGNISKDNVFASSYGTLILEYEKGKSIFSLEIGRDSFGYFGEIDGKTIHFCEEASLSNLIKINEDFFDFYKRLL